MATAAQSFAQPNISPGRSPATSALLVAAVATAVVLAIQTLTVVANYGGRSSALFYHGEGFQQAPLIVFEDVYLFPGYGYDGQIYHVMAHDPFFQRGLDGYVDDPRLRYRRILVPGLAHLLAFGHDPAVDIAYRCVVLAFVGLGAFWVARFAMEHHLRGWWGLAFLLVPAVWVSVDRLTVDVSLAALTAGLVLYGTKAPRWPLMAILVLAGLSRETGLLLPAGYALFAALNRSWRSMLVGAAAMLPALAWFLFVSAHTAPRAYPNSYVPLRGIVSAWAAPPATVDGAPIGSTAMSRWKRVSGSIERAAERVALSGVLLALGLAAFSLRNWRRGPHEVVALLFALLVTFVQREDNWRHVYDYGRVCSPLLIILALRALAERTTLLAVPSILMWPRLLLQVRTQLVGLARFVV